ncbi:cardiolipin synthase ClsB [Marinobacterium lutimaris]|uniref:Cardiolipin synthase B n=1 Tax=Marinobacterium lutimaris TaxID=568106 RepID=A0A1H6DU44_9GAMM|nr:cardiolipin synthase ClsB [Marinobacterium lutimaris]SEG88798.1 cardiolipin synthase [Marinobacterium lutimaris]
MPQRKPDHRRRHHAQLSAGWSGFVTGNQLTLLQNGEEYFPALEAAFDRARYEIHLQTYLYENDATGQRVAAALQRAALRGVKVCVLIDGFGSRNLPRQMRERMRSDGVNLLIYRPKISPWTFRRKRLRRMHRKIVTVDREIAFVGGINIVGDRTANDDQAPRYDYAVAVEGPLVEAIRLAAQRLWSRLAWLSLHKEMAHRTKMPASTFTGGSMSAAFLLRDNIRHRRDIEAAYLQAIRQAQSEILLAHAYFLPGLEFRHALIGAVQRGVRVVLLLQGKVEYRLEYYAVRALYGCLLDNGIEIYEYRKSFLHAKVAVVDDHWATIGSSNIDPFSLLLSLEANLVVDNDAFGAGVARRLKETVQTDGWRIRAEGWQQQPTYIRVFSWLSYGLLRLMRGISGYERENGRARSQ